MATSVAPIRPSGIVDPDYFWNLNQNPPSAGDPYLTPQNQFKENIDDGSNQTRRRAIDFGYGQEQEFSQRGLPYYRDERRYGQAGDVAYAPLGMGQAGYSPEEQARIQPDLGYLQQTSGERDRVGMSPDEQRAIVGDPYAAGAYFNPQLMSGMAESAGARQYERFNEGSGGVRGAAYDPSLTIDPRFAGSQQGALSTLEAGTSEAIDPARLRLDPGFAENYPISDEEIQSLSTLASQTAGARYGADEQDIQRQARASGMVTPLARAAMGQRLRRYGAQEASDAASRARLGGLSQQREQMRQAEGMRLGAEQGLTDRQLETAFGVAGQRIGTQSDTERLRSGLAGNAAGLRTGAEQYLLGTGLGTERDVFNRKLDVGRYNQETGMGQARYAESESARRNQNRYGLRQDAERYNQAQRYGRGMDIGDRYSQRGQGVADARRGDEREYRDYLERSRDYSGGQAGRASDRRQRGFGLSQNAENQAMQTRLGRRNSPGFFERSVLPSLLSGSKSAAGGFGK